MTLPARHAISRAWFFLEKACACSVEERNACEAFMEAAIVFARAALHRAQALHGNHPAWPAWWRSLEKDPAVQFFRVERDWLLKEAPPRVGQIIRFGGSEAARAVDFYYFENPQTPATETIWRHLESFETALINAEQSFAVTKGHAV